MTARWTHDAYSLADFLTQIIPSLDHTNLHRPLDTAQGFTQRRKSKGMGIEIQYARGEFCEIQIRDQDRFVQLTGVIGDDDLIRLKTVDLGKFIHHHEQITHRFIWQGEAGDAPKTARFQAIEPAIDKLDPVRLEATCAALDHVAGVMFDGLAPQMDKLQMDKLSAVFDPAPVTQVPAIGPYRLSARRINRLRRTPKLT